jgi:hypothetical protein
LIAKELGSNTIAFFVIEQPLVSKPVRQHIRTRAGPFSRHRCDIYLRTSRLLI